MTISDRERTPAHQTRAERLSHALYGLIIVTATLVAEKDHVTEPSRALQLVLGAGAILLLAHTYSGLMAERLVAASRLGSLGRRLVVRDNVPVLAAIVVPSVMFVFASFDVLSIQQAYVLSIAFCIVALFGLGMYAARSASMTWGRSFLSGVLGAIVGLAVITLEALID